MLPARQEGLHLAAIGPAVVGLPPCAGAVGETDATAAAVVRQARFAQFVCIAWFRALQAPPSRTVSRDAPGSSSKQLSLHSLKSKVLRIFTHCDFETGRWMRSQRPCRLRTCCILSRPGDRKLFAQVHLVMRDAKRRLVVMQSSGSCYIAAVQRCLDRSWRAAAAVRVISQSDDPDRAVMRPGCLSCMRFRIASRRSRLHRTAFFCCFVAQACFLLGDLDSDRSGYPVGAAGM